MHVVGGVRFVPGCNDLTEIESKLKKKDFSSIIDKDKLTRFRLLSTAFYKKSWNIRRPDPIFPQNQLQVKIPYLAELNQNNVQY